MVRSLADRTFHLWVQRQELDEAHGHRYPSSTQGNREGEILAKDVALPFHRRVPEEEATVHDAELRVEIHGLAARVNLGIERERDGGDHAVGRVPEVPDVAHLLGCK